ncbi:hypothetical protein MMC29_006370 [Sticta canariensis]|nr:hypothetical protein [Sticta canariensis]
MSNSAPKKKADSRVNEDLFRISVGTEHIGDTIQDFKQSFAASAASKPDGTAQEENPDLNGKAKGDAILGVAMIRELSIV